MRDPYVALVPAGDPFLELGRPLTATDLTSRDLIGKDCTTASQRALSAALSDYGLGVPRIRAHDLREVQALVRRGLGIAVVPQLLLDAPDPTLATIPVGHLVPDRVIAVTTRANGARTPAVEFAAEILRSCPRQSLMFSGRQACQSSISIQADTRGLSRNGYGSPM